MGIRYLESTIMKFFAIVAVGLLALASYSEAKKGKGGEDKGTIIRCMAENWKEGEAQIQACRDCFKAIGGDYLSETGLAAAKECTASYLPMENEACASEIAAVTAGNAEQLGDIIECFDETLETKNYERCLNDAQGTSEEKLTSGALCVLESWKYGMEYVKNATRGAGGRPGGRGRGRGRGRRPRGRGGRGKKGKGMKKKMMMKMLTIAHCDAANPDDDTKQDQCEQCFKDAVKSVRRPRANKAAMKTALIACSEEHLSSLYSDCTALAKQEDADKEQVFNCYIKVLVNNTVKQCSTEKGITEATAETLDAMMECGKERVGELVKENASPEALEKIGNMLGMEDDDDSDEDVRG